MSEPIPMSAREAIAALEDVYRERRAYVIQAEALIRRRDALLAELAAVREQIQAIAARKDADLAAYRARRAELEAVIGPRLETMPTG
jgi:hypothetical protein